MPLTGLIRDKPLMNASIIRHAARYHTDTEIVSRTIEGGLFRYTYGQAHARICQLAHALGRLGMQPGDRVGALAWNTHRQFEMFYGVSGTGAVLHTVNPRLFPEQLDYIINHAEDRLLFVDAKTLPIVEKIAPQLSTVEAQVMIADRAGMPATTTLLTLLCFEDLLFGPLIGLRAHNGDLPVMMPMAPMFHGNAWQFPYLAPMHGAKLVQARMTSGHAAWGVDYRLVDDDGRELPQDGQTVGHFRVKAPWVSNAYFKNEGGSAVDAQGWLKTGDLASIAPDGRIQLTDRSKDVIKSGGEWISSVELENLAMGHPAVLQAAVIAVPHPRWQERPLLVVVRKPGAALDAEAMLAFLRGKAVDWWLPDDVAFVDSLPMTGTGKIHKLTLRQQFAGHVLPGTVPGR